MDSFVSCFVTSNQHTCTYLLFKIFKIHDSVALPSNWRTQPYLQLLASIISLLFHYTNVFIFFKQAQNLWHIFGNILISNHFSLVVECLVYFVIFFHSFKKKSSPFATMKFDTKRKWIFLPFWFTKHWLWLYRTFENVGFSNTNCIKWK